MPRLRVASLLATSLLISVGCGHDWESVDEVRAAILRAGVMGQPPSEVERRLAALRFGDGRRLEVGSFWADHSEVGAQLRDAHGQPRDDYNVNVSVHFDASKRADSVDVHTSAVNPL